MIYYITKEKFLFEDTNEIIYTDNINLVFEYFQESEEIAFDTETTGFSEYTDKLLLYQLGDRDTQFVIDPDFYPVTTVRILLEDKDKTILMQNAKFDLRFLYHQKVIPNTNYDTYLAEAVLFTGIKTARKGLDHLALKYCDVILDKSVRSAIHREGKSTRVIKYAANDVKYLHEIKERQLEELEKKDLLVALELDNMFVRVLAYVEHCGIYLDKELWSAKMVRDDKELKVSSTLLCAVVVGLYVHNVLGLASLSTNRSIIILSPRI